MLELLQHLWPDFSLLDTKKTEPLELSVWFWTGMVIIFVVAILSVLLHYGRFLIRLKALRSLIGGQTKENLALHRRDTLQKALALKNSDVGMLWREFDESLVSSGDQKQLFNTLDAEHFFNSRSLAQGLTASRLLAATPSFLVAIGVLGTFMGLTIGLKELHVDASEVETLKGGVSQMINGASIAFMTSVWGVGFSLALNMLEKLFERSALRRIHKLQHEIDFLYPRIPAEQSLVHIADASRESKEALQELHERIGDRLQETISGMSDSMQQAFTDALNNVMAPAIQTIATNAGQQSSEALKELVGKFMDGVNSAGEKQGASMQKAADDVNSALTSITGRMDELFSKLSQQQEQTLAATTRQNTDFATKLEEFNGAADKRQSEMETRFSGLMSGLTEQLSAQLDAARKNDEERQSAFAKVLEESATRQREASEEQQKSADLRERTRTEQFEKQLDAVSSQQQQLIKELQSIARDQMTSMEESASRQRSLLNEQLAGADERERARAEQHRLQIDEFSNSQKAIATQLQQTSEQQIRAMGEAATTSQRGLESMFQAMLAELNKQMAEHGKQAHERDAALQKRFDDQMQALVAEQQKLLDAVSQAVLETQKQSLQMAQQHQTLMSGLRDATSATEKSSQNMNSSAAQLGILSTNLRQATEVLDTRLKAVTESLEGASDRNSALAEQVKQQADTIASLQGSLTEMAQHFESAAISARDGFANLGSQQQAFLNSVRQEFTSLGEALRSQVEGIEKQADEWLRSYSGEVRKQIEERMEEWNKATLAFASQMHSTVSAISNIVDELEVR